MRRLSVLGLNRTVCKYSKYDANSCLQLHTCFYKNNLSRIMMFKFVQKIFKSRLRTIKARLQMNMRLQVLICGVSIAVIKYAVRNTEGPSTLTRIQSIRIRFTENASIDPRPHYRFHSVSDRPH